MPRPLRETLEALLERRDLSEQEAFELLLALTDAEMAPPMAGALLAALRAKGVRADEVRGFARGMRSLARHPRIAAGAPVADVVGTGGGCSRPRPACASSSTATAPCPPAPAAPTCWSTSA